MAGPWEKFGTTTEDDAGPWAKFATPALTEDKPKEAEVGALQAGLEGAGQGLSFGFSDEIEAAARAAYDKFVSGAPSYAEAYDERLSGARERQNKASTDQPVAYYGGEIAGGLAMPMGAAKLGVRGVVAAADRTLLPRIVSGIKEGGTYGGLYGAGKSEGDLGDVALGTLGGAAAGATVGAVLPGLVDVGSNVVRGVTRPIKAMFQPERVGNQKVAEAFLRDNTPSAQPRRTRMGTVNQAERKLAKASRSQPDIMLADFGGENLRNLVKAASNIPSTGAQRLNNTLNARQTNQWRQIERSLHKNLGWGDKAYATIEALDEGAKKAAGPMFRKAFNSQLPMTPELQEVIKRPHIQRLFELAEEQAQNEGKSLANVNPVEILHRVKIQIDRQIGQVKRGIQDSKANWDARTLTILKNDLKNNIKVPEYQQALTTYSGPMAIKNAIEDGMDDALKLPIEELAATMAKLSPGEQVAYRMGAGRALIGKIRQGNVMRDRTDGVFSSPDMQTRLKVLFPDQKSLREFQRDLVIQAKKADTRKHVQGGSSTAKQLAQGDEAGQDVRAVHAVANAATGRLEPLMAFLGRHAQRFSGLTPASANAIIDAVMVKGGSGMSAELRTALAEAAKVPELRARLVQRMMAGSTAGAVPGAGGDDLPNVGLHGSTPYKSKFDDTGEPAQRARGGGIPTDRDSDPVKVDAAKALSRPGNRVEAFQSRPPVGGWSLPPIPARIQVDQMDADTTDAPLRPGFRLIDP